LTVLRHYLPIQRILLLLCFVLLLAFSPGVCSAAEISQTDLNRLSEIFSQLELNLQTQDEKSAKVEALLIQSATLISQLQMKLEKAEQSTVQALNYAEKAERSLAEYSKEQKKIQQRLKIERDLACLGILAALFVRR